MGVSAHELHSSRAVRRRRRLLPGGGAHWVVARMVNSINRPFVAERPRVTPLPARLHDVAKFEVTLGQRGDDDYHVTIGSTLDETLPRFAGIVNRERVYAAHRARSWSE